MPSHSTKLPTSLLLGLTALSAATLVGCQAGAAPGADSGAPSASTTQVVASPSSAPEASTPASPTSTASPEAPTSPPVPSSATATSSAPEPKAEDINGRWCPTPESADTECVTVALPNATWETRGITEPIRLVGEEQGSFTYSAEGAPFGVYAPAGVALELPDYYNGGDMPEVERIWNGQTNVLYLRQD